MPIIKHVINFIVPFVRSYVYSLIIVFVFLFESVFPTWLFTAILYCVALGLAVLNVAQIKTPKLSGSPVNVYLLAIYTLGITGIYGWELL